LERKIAVRFIARYALIAALASASLAVIAQAAFSRDEAWSRAVTQWRAGEAWKPRSLVMEFEEQDAEGNRTKLVEITTRLSYENPDKPTSHIEKALENGKDVTEEWRKKKGGGQEFEDLTPFRAALQGSIALGAPSVRRQAGRSYQVVPYAVKGKSLGAAGNVWFDQAGEPYRAVYEYSGLPLGMTGVSASQVFGKASEGALVATELVIRYDVTVLFERKRGVMRMRFSSWFIP
jgi:hypothetical protein